MWQRKGQHGDVSWLEHVLFHEKSVQWKAVICYDMVKVQSMRQRLTL